MKQASKMQDTKGDIDLDDNQNIAVSEKKTQTPKDSMIDKDMMAADNLLQTEFHLHDK